MARTRARRSRHRNVQLTSARSPEIFTDAGTPSDTATSIPRCVRRTENKILGGVAGGLADHLGFQVLYVRIGFLALSMLGGFGIVLYGALWIVLRQDPGIEAAREAAPGVAAATRGGMRQARRPGRREDFGQLVAVSVLAIGVILLGQTLGDLPGRVFWPLVVGGLGLALLWRQADDAQRARWTAGVPTRFRWLAPIVGADGGWRTAVRAIVGLAFVMAAATWTVAGVTQIGQLWRAFVAMLIGLAGVALIVGPWVWRLTVDVSEERRERIRSQERADMAAHLHDSVLQTLALIQNKAQDPKAVVRLARAQERDLRQWLYGDTGSPDTTLKAALRTAAAEVEDSHGTPIEVVLVGDAPLDDDLRAMVQAGREAMVNAAKHSGAPRIDVYAEIEDDEVAVFVRDRGAGFDPDSMPEDRLGVRRSILGRMERHGGKAEIVSSPGSGTEIRLTMPRTPGATGSQGSGDRPDDQQGVRP